MTTSLTPSTPRLSGFSETFMEARAALPKGWELRLDTCSGGFHVRAMDYRGETQISRHSLSPDGALRQVIEDMTTMPMRLREGRSEHAAVFADELEPTTGAQRDRLRDAPSLDAEWAEAEAAIGHDDMLWVGRGAHGYTARSDPPPGMRMPKSPRAHGATPTEALRNLIDLLKGRAALTDPEAQP